MIMSPMQESKVSPLSPAERQKRYRATRRLVSIDVSREVTEQLSALRGRTSMTTDALISTSLAAFATSLDRKLPPAAKWARSGVLADASPEPRASKPPKPRTSDQQRRRRNSSPGDNRVDAAVPAKAAGPDTGRDASPRAPEEGKAEGTAAQGRRSPRRVPGFQGSLALFGEEDV